MTLPLKFWPRVLGLVLVAGSFAVMYGLDNGLFTMNWVLRIVNLTVAVCGGQLLVYGTTLRLKKNESDGTFPFWRKK